MRRMITAMVECPATGKLISTGLQMHDAGFASLADFIRSVRCPLCGRDHQWRKRDARLMDTPLPDEADDKQASQNATGASSRKADLPAATGNSAPKAESFRFFLFDGAGHCVRMRMAECEDPTSLSTVTRALLESEELQICAIEAWDTTQRICRAERPAYPSSRPQAASNSSHL